MLYRLIISIFLLTSTSSALAEENALDLEIRWGAGAFRSSTDLSDYGAFYYTKRQDLDSEIVGTLAQNLGSAVDQTNAFLLANAAPDPSLKSKQLSFLLDYSLFPIRSLGLEIQHSEIEALNFGYSKIVVGLGYLINSSTGNPLSLTDGQFVQIENLLPYYRQSKSQFLRLDTLNLAYTYHLSGFKILDPFIRIRIGIGRESVLGYRVYRSGLSAGSKWFLTESLYITAELGYENYAGFYEPSDYAWTLDNYTAQIGAGFRL